MKFFKTDDNQYLRPITEDYSQCELCELLDDSVPDTEANGRICVKRATVILSLFKDCADYESLISGLLGTYGYDQEDFLWDYTKQERNQLISEMLFECNEVHPTYEYYDSLEEFHKAIGYSE